MQIPCNNCENSPTVQEWNGEDKKKCVVIEECKECGHGKLETQVCPYPTCDCQFGVNKNKVCYEETTNT